jgi:glutamate 5-kinase
VINDARRIVVKIGSSLIDGSPAARPAQIADQVAPLIRAGREFVIVSSGAIALGVRELGFARRPTALPMLQAAAAVGQNRLLVNWQHGFAAHKIPVGQVLLTHDDIAHRDRFINARCVLRALIDAGAVPVINENDTVSTEEIKYGDNDRLAALVANLISADALIILTDVDGLLDAPPERGGVRISRVTDLDDATRSLAGGARRDGVGSGGMASKIEAARAAARQGVTTVVANGTDPSVITRVVGGDDVGTVFVPPVDRINSRKHWLAYGGKPEGRLVVDGGAHRAVVEPARGGRDRGRGELFDGRARDPGHRRRNRVCPRTCGIFRG